MKLIRILLTLVLFFGMKITYGQSKIWRVKGKVFDEQTKTGIADVNIYNKVKTSTARSTAVGDFELALDRETDSLYFHKIGYIPKSIAIDNLDKEQEVYLTPSLHTIDEVVVNTGYQKLKANEITGSYQVLSAKDLMRQASPNLLQRINNESVGLQLSNVSENTFGQETPQFTVRGLNTINGSTAPLIVLDGFIYEGNLSNIDPNNVASISILKDAAATSIWGARAGNGVIVITTKGMQLDEQPTSISFNKLFTLKSEPNLGDVYMMNSKDFIDIEKIIFEKGYYDQTINRTPYIALTPAVEILLQHRLNNITEEQKDSKLLALSKINGPQNFMDNFLNKPFTDQYFLNITGGTKRHSYGLGAGLLKDKNYDASGYQKLNLNFTNSFKPIEALRIDFNVMYSNGTQRSGKAKYSEITFNRKSVPYLSFTDNSGLPIPVDITFRSAYLNSTYGEDYLDWNYYPTEEWKHNRSSNLVEEIYSNAAVHYKIFPFLEATVAGQYQMQRTHMQQHQSIESYAMRMLINQFSSFDNNTESMHYAIPMGGRLTQSRMDGRSYTFRGQLNGQKEWGQHGFIFLLGSEVRENLMEGSTSSLYGYSEDPLRNIAVNYATYYPQIPAGGTGTIPGAPMLSHGLNRFVSLYGNAVYTLANKYNLSMSMRRDGANIFGAQTNDRWRPLWSIGTSWNILQEKFWDISWVNMLKIRTTFGYSGNVDLRRTPLPIGSTSTALYTNFPSIVIDNLNDPSLRWEKVSTWNLGLDYGLFENRLSGSIDYYRKTADDLYGQTTYDYTVWGRQATIINNSAMMKSSGIDLIVNSKNIIGDFVWNSRLLFALNKDKTVKYYNTTATNLSAMLSNEKSINPIIDFPLNAIAAFKWGGLNENGDPQGYLNGELSTDYNAIRLEGIDLNNRSDNIIIFGSAKPQIFGSLLNSFGYKGFSLDVNLSFKADYYVRKPSTSYVTLFANGDAYRDIEKRWQKPGDELTTDMPALKYPVVSNRETFYKSSSIHVIKGDHIRLEYVNLSWAGHLRAGTKNIPIEIYAQMQNLGILWRKNEDHVDPEFMNRFRPLRSNTLGLRITY